jgi:hypothetical protein
MMIEQKRSRGEAFETAHKALDLVQDLSFHAILRDPKALKLRYRFLPWVWWKEMNESHEYFKLLHESAKDLYSELLVWAKEYPVDEGGNDD